MTTTLAALVMPGVRWDADAGEYRCEGATFDQALALGVGGFCLFGGTADAARRLTAWLSARSATPLLIAADLERGAGQQLAGLTPLPPLAALGWLDDADVMRRAGQVTAREALSCGVNMVLAPVLDLDVQPDNPIVGTRAIGGEPARVAELGAAWIAGCQRAGAMACAKHFPGHGRTTADSHATLPVVDATHDTLLESDLVPFAAAVEEGVAAVMSCHVAYPSLDPSGEPATLSRRILRGLLRRELGFEGLVVTDAMIMAGVQQGRGEYAAAVAALDAGCDLLLYPTDVAATVAAIEAAAGQAALSAEHLRQSLERRALWADRVAAADPAALADDIRWARDIRQQVIHVVRGTPPSPGRRIRLVVVDDDIGGPYPAPSRAPLADTLRAGGVELVGGDGTGGAAATADWSDPGVTTVVALFGDIRAWKGRPGYSAAAVAAVGAALAQDPAALVLQFGHPRLIAQIDAGTVVSAWGGEAGMQQAAAAWLLSRT
jgi:beta-glucosidase-like glycosyl hydrolase